MNGQQAAPRQPMSTRKKVLIAAAVLLGGPPLAAGMIAGAKSEQPGQPVAAASSTPPKAATSKAASPRPKPAPVAAEPTWVYPGDPHCKITYRDRGDGSTTWTATVTVAGELKTHAGGSDGTLYAHDVHVDAGPAAFAAPVPPAQITDIGGVLYTPGHSYSCSIAPQR